MLRELINLYCRLGVKFGDFYLIHRCSVIKAGNEFMEHSGQVIILSLPSRGPSHSAVNCRVSCLRFVEMALHLEKKNRKF